jgi:hypothetical protein
LGVIIPCRSIARSTRLRRATAAAGSTNGSYADGAFVSPASSAACDRVKRLAEREKYVWDAASAPYARFP